MAGSKVLSASYVLDAAALAPGIAAADAQLAGLEDSTADLSARLMGTPKKWEPRSAIWGPQLGPTSAAG